MKNNITSEVAIKKIDNIENEIHKIWTSLNVYDLKQLQDAWNDSVSKEYIEKISKLDNIVNSIISSLDDLKLYWVNYKNKEITDSTTKSE